MILLADSGSTKTEWVLAEGIKILDSFKTVGLNPYFVSSVEVVDILKDEFKQELNGTAVDAVYFYGAGCSSEAKQEIISNALQTLFPGKPILVEHDMLAAARALFQDYPGIASILGTGSNACVYDGNNITESLFSLGYLFGDEGSGAHLGKTYIADFLKQSVPDDVAAAFIHRYTLSKEEILTAIYKKSNPNRFLASFTRFLKDHIGHPYVYGLVKSCFDEFFEEQIVHFMDYQSLPLGCVGSVGYHFRDVLIASAKNYGVQPIHFMVSPIEGLVSYHSKPR